MLSDRDREWWLLWMLRGWPSSLLVYALVSRWTIHPCTLRLSKNHVVCQHGSCWPTHQWSICSSFTRHQSPIASFKPQAVWIGPIMLAPPRLYWVPNRVTWVSGHSCLAMAEGQNNYLWDVAFLLCCSFTWNGPMKGFPIYLFQWLGLDTFLIRCPFIILL